MWEWSTGKASKPSLDITSGHTQFLQHPRSFSSFFFHLLSFPHLSFWGDHCLFHVSSGQKGSVCSSQVPPHTNGPGSVGKQNGAGLMGSPPALTWGLRGWRNQQHTRPAADEPAWPPHLSGSKQSVCVSASLTSPHLCLWVRFPCHSSIPGLQVEEAALVQSRCQCGETAFFFFSSLQKKNWRERPSPVTWRRHEEGKFPVTPSVCPSLLGLTNRQRGQLHVADKSLPAVQINSSVGRIRIF